MENNEIIPDMPPMESSGTPKEPGLDNIESPGQDESASFFDKLRANRRLFCALRIFLGFIVSVIFSILIIVYILYYIPELQDKKPGKATEISNNPELKKDKAYKNQINLMTKDINRFSRKYNAYTSGQSYIVINTIDNRFKLYSNKKLIREGLCSSGKNELVQAPGGKTFYFRTPKGKMPITGKRKHPYWHRSDWDFIEQGLPIPPKDDPSRWEYGTLGDYALDMIDGYMIHGTPYKRMMGMPVTHGCIRLLDEDLIVVFNTLNIGSKVYIF